VQLADDAIAYSKVEHYGEESRVFMSFDTKQGICLHKAARSEINAYMLYNPCSNINWSVYQAGNFLVDSPTSLASGLATKCWCQ